MEWISLRRLTTFWTSVKTYLGQHFVPQTRKINNHALTQDLTLTASDVGAVTSAFTGATRSAAGAIGLVPAPTAGQQNMFLKGDGTWGETGGGDVQAVNEVSPDSNGNVALTAADIPTSAVSGETEVDGALSSLSDKIANLGPFNLSIDMATGHLIGTYSSAEQAAKWSVNSNGHLIYTI